MSRLELTICPQYIQSWGIWEALRELAQNSFDQETVDDSSTSGINYTSSEQKMIFSNANTTLPKSALLLGKTSKSEDETCLGQYGEGFKLALLVLTRMGMRVKILNGKEEWTPKIIKSRRYDSDLLVIDTSKAKRPHSDLSFVVEGVTPTMFAEFATKCLTINYPTNIIETTRGNILLDENQKGNIYCGGLFVQKSDDTEMRHGYDIKPEHVILDRDRRTVDSWSLCWLTARMFAEVRDGEHREQIYNLITDNASDVKYYYDVSKNRTDDLYKDLCEDEYQDFLKKHGVHAVPVKNEEDARLIRSKYKNFVPVIMPETKVSVVTASASYQDVAVKNKIDIDLSAVAILTDFLEKNREGMSEEVQENFVKLYKFAKSWKITSYDDLPF